MVLPKKLYTYGRRANNYMFERVENWSMHGPVTKFDGGMIVAFALGSGIFCARHESNPPREIIYAATFVGALLGAFWPVPAAAAAIGIAVYVPYKIAICFRKNHD